jgi:hypothetical protein
LEIRAQINNKSKNEEEELLPAAGRHLSDWEIRAQINNKSKRMKRKSCCRLPAAGRHLSNSACSHL